MSMIVSSGKTFKFMTFGCKVNQYETQAIREMLEDSGAKEISQTGGPADFVIINTCTVTQDADRANRYWIRRLRRENPDCKLVVTGCFAERDARVLKDMSEIDLVFTNQQKNKISHVLLNKGPFPSDGSGSSKKDFLPLSIRRNNGKTRANVKIQDGCDHACSYCKVVLVRGRSRSRALTDILEEVKKLRDSGYREIVLTGIQLGAYGRDLGRRDDYSALEGVVEKCATIEGIERIRLSSIEPTDIHDSLIQAFRDIPKLCPQLHIPLQSGADEILKIMNRRYTASFYIALINNLRNRIPDFCLTLDVIVGFPGETSEHFQKSMEVLRQVRPVRSHVFPYSRREGTRAAWMKDVPGNVKRERTEQMIAYAEAVGQEVRKEYIGRTYPVLVEHRKLGSKYWEGWTSNYLRVFFDSPGNVQGCIIPVILKSLKDSGFKAEPV